MIYGKSTMQQNKPTKKYSLKQTRTVENYFNPRNRETFGNLYESAVQAGFSKSYAKSIVRDTEWIQDLKLQLKQYGPDHIYQSFQDLAQSAERDSDKIKALELMGKAQGMFIDRSVQDVHVKFINDMPRPETEIIEGERIDND